MKIICNTRSIYVVISLIIINLFTNSISVFAGKVPDGKYASESGTDGLLEVRGGQYRIQNLDGTFPWKSNSNLVVIKKGIIQEKSNKKFYYCLVKNLPSSSSNSYKCTVNGWKLDR
jgi:hypothetical protein